MKKMKNGAAILGGVAALAVLSASAISAFAYETVKLDDRADELTEGTINIVADEVYAEPGETVSYSVWIKNNTGYAESGIVVVYDSDLTVVQSEPGKVEMTVGVGAAGLLTANNLNLDKRRVSFSSMGAEECTNDGVIFTVKFTVPEDAAIGTVYPMSLEVPDLLTYAMDPLDYAVVSGWITVREPATTTTTTTATTTSTTVTTTSTTVSSTTTSTSTSTTVTTSVVTTTTVTTSVTTSDTIASDGTTTTTSQTSVMTGTSTIPDDPSTSKTTKKTDRDPSKDATNPNPGGNTNTSKTTASPKTGDPGMGAAVAALLLAGTSATIFGRKKKN